MPLVHYKQGKLLIDVHAIDSDEIREAVNLEAPFTSSSQLQNVSLRLQSHLATAYRTFISRSLDHLLKEQELSALLLEPLMLGAGSLRFVDPLYQKVLVQECRSRGLPIVFDENATG